MYFLRTILPIHVDFLFYLCPQSKATIYEQEVYNQFAYKKDRPFFHSFPGDVSLDLRF